ncbi:uncharacterized protein LOC110117921 [Ceratitis capitata]|uniref:uncharacterized protein LOC110117921 n=1 Tax=Ceratitis capitata TaxID=7213 RepID=UPI000A0FA9A7|nr:uncharacterized protein LOC110117921 [Ceratitis capitata]
MYFLNLFFIALELYTTAKLSFCEGRVRRCEVLESFEMKRVCIGTYPKEISIKYRDKMMTTGAQYAIFQLSDGKANHYVISHYFSPLIKCVSARFITPLTYSCTTKNGEAEVINLENSFMHCITEHLQIVDDLLVLCTEERMKPSVFVALQYSTKKLPQISTSAARITPTPQFVLVLITLIL